VTPSDSDKACTRLTGAAVSWPLRGPASEVHLAVVIDSHDTSARSSNSMLW
jgi:hypothetical protein